MCHYLHQAEGERWMQRHEAQLTADEESTAEEEIEVEGRDDPDSVPTPSD